MKKNVKIVLITVLVLILAMPVNSKALTLTEIFTGANEFIDSATGQELFNQQNEEDAINTMYWALLGIAVAAALIYGLIMGIQFITAGVSEQAKIKEKLIPYAVGCVVAFGAFGIWKLVLNILNSTV